MYYYDSDDVATAVICTIIVMVVGSFFIADLSTQTHDVGTEQRVCMITKSDVTQQVKTCISGEELLEVLRKQGR